MAGNSAPKELRHELVRDAVIGTAYRLSNSDVFLYPFTDLLSLYFQRSLVFSFWCGDELLFSSLQDAFHFRQLETQLRDTRSKVQVSLGSGYEISIHELTSDRLVARKGLAKELKSLISALKDSEGKDGKIFEETVYAALAARPPEQRPPAMVAALRRPNTTAQRIEYERILQNLDPMRSVLDSALAEAAESPFLHRPAELTPDCINVFAAFRTIPGPGMRYSDSFNYTAGLLLSNKQREAISVFLSRKGGLTRTCGELLAAMEIPLGPTSRSVADALFSSGIVDFGRRAGEQNWDVADGESDVRRTQAERIVYPAFGPKKALFYVPIHVGGTPWVAIFTPTNHDLAANASSWRHNYRFYRDTIVVVADRIRNGAKTAFADLVTKRLLAELNRKGATKGSICQRVSAEWLGLAQTYPFPLIRLEEKSTSPLSGAGAESSIDLPVEGMGVFLAFVCENPFFGRQVDYQTTSVSDIENLLQNAVNSRNGAARLAKAGATAMSPHLLKVPIASLKTLVESHVRESGLRERMVNILGEMSALEVFGGALIRPDEGQRFFETAYEEVPQSEFQRLLGTIIDQYQATQLDDVVSRGTARILQGLHNTDRQTIDLQLPEGIGRTIRHYPAQLVAVVHELLTNALGKQPVEPSAKRLHVELVVDDKKAVYLVVRNATTERGPDLANAMERLELGGAGQIGITVIQFACEVCGYSRPRWSSITDSGRDLVQAKVQIGWVK